MNYSDKAGQAPEPVFSVAEALAFQNFRTVSRMGLVDPALLNAVMLSFTFAVWGQHQWRVSYVPGSRTQLYS